MSGPTYNQPPVPSYGEGMREALEAQVALLAGTKVGDADFSQFEGGLRELVREYEAPLRRETAQIDTDVLRQTLLGTERKVVRDPETGKFGIPGAEPVGQQQFRIEETFTERADGIGVTQFDLVDPDTGDLILREFIRDKTPSEARLELSKNKQVTQGLSEADIERLKNPDTDFASANFGDGEPQTAGGGRYQIVMTEPSIITIPNTGAVDVNGAVYSVIDIDTGGILDTFGGETKRLPSGSANAASRVEAEFNKAAIESAAAQLRSVQKTFETDGPEAVAREFEFTNPNIPADPSKAGQEGFDSEGRALLQEGQVVREGDGMIDLLGDRRNIMETRRLSRDERGAQLVEQNPELSALYEGAQNDPTNPFYGLTKQQAGRKLLDDNEGDLQKISEQFGIGNLTAPEFANVDTGRQAGFDEQGNFLGLSALAEDVQRANLSRQREADLADVERLSSRFQDVMADFRPGTTEALAGARDVLRAQQDRLTRPATQDDVQAGTATQVGDMISAGFQDPVFDAPTALGTDAGLARFDEIATQADVDAGRATTVGETIQVDPLRQRLIRDARSALDEGLTEREERQIAEAARARATMMGRTFDQKEAIAEAQARVAEDNQRRMQNRAFASQILGQEAGLQSGDLGRGMQQELRQVGADMDAERLRQAQTAGFIDASTRLAGLEASTTMDPFAALLNRAGGGSLGQAGQVLGQAGYGLASGPQFLNPEAGLGFISQMAANEASMYGANVAADAARTAGLYQGIGSAIGGGLQGYGYAKCWVAREVYGPLNPQWLQFRSWLDTEAPNWFYNLYLKFGERFANWISDKPRIKAIIRKWMDTKIRG